MSTGTQQKVTARPHHSLTKASFFIKLNTSLEDDNQILFSITTPPKEGVIVSEDGFTIEIEDGFIERSRYEPCPITGFRTKCGTPFSPPQKHVKEIRIRGGGIISLK